MSANRPLKAVPRLALACAIGLISRRAAAEPYVGVEAHAEAFAHGGRNAATPVRVASAYGGALLGGWAFRFDSVVLAPEIVIRSEARPRVYETVYAGSGDYAIVDTVFVGGLRLGIPGAVSPSFFAHTGGGFLFFPKVSQTLQFAFPVDFGISLDAEVSRVVTVGFSAAYSGLFVSGTTGEDTVDAPRWMHGVAIGPRIGFRFPSAAKPDKIVDPELPPPIVGSR